MRDVTDVACVGGTRLLLTFDDGALREIDIATLTDFKGVFEALKDPGFFRRVHVVADLGTIAWPNGADFCPDSLYEKSTPAKAPRSG